MTAKIGRVSEMCMPCPPHIIQVLRASLNLHDVHPDFPTSSRHGIGGATNCRQALLTAVGARLPEVSNAAGVGRCQ
jgi:hypothetical protein